MSDRCASATPGTDKSKRRFEDINPRALAIQMALGIGVFLASLAILGRIYYEQVLAVSRTFVEVLGGFGVAMAFFMTDGLPIPVPPDPALAFALLGGMNFWSVLAWGAAGSLVGGCLGFAVGRWFSRRRFFSVLIAGKRARIYELVDRYGVFGLALTTLTPLPYCIGAYASGALNMPFGTFFLVSLLRVLRVAIYLSLLYFGIVNLL